MGLCFDSRRGNKIVRGGKGSKQRWRIDGILRCPTWRFLDLVVVDKLIQLP